MGYLKPQKNGNRDPSSVAVSCSKKRGLGGGGFRPSSSVRPSVVSGKTRVFRIAKKGQVAKKMKRPTTAGAACRRAQRPATPAHVQAPRRQLPNQGAAKNGELLGPKVKGQMGYSKANI